MEKIYRHFKGGYYRFITEVTNSETQRKKLFIRLSMGSTRFGIALLICSTDR